MDIKWVYQEELKGKRLADLKHTDLNCKLELLEKIAIEEVMCSSLVSVILIIVIIILLKFRREIRILTYTRFNIIYRANILKRMETFVSYSNKD